MVNNKLTKEQAEFQYHMLSTTGYIDNRHEVAIENVNKYGSVVALQLAQQADELFAAINFVSDQKIKIIPSVSYVTKQAIKDLVNPLEFQV